MVRIIKWSACALMTFMLVACAPAYDQSQDVAQWVPTWTASPLPSASSPFAPAVTFENVTLRQITHVSVGGNQLRLRVSNTFGTQDLELGGAHVAMSSQGASIENGSDHKVTFSGTDSIIIPAGATILSDPVAMAVPAFADVAISLYLPGSTGPATIHQTALQTGYTSEPGNHLDATTLPVAEELNISAFLAGVEVMAEANTPVIVAFGDSITDGAGSTPNANHRWPDYLAQRLAQAGISAAVVNQGISGNRVLHDAIGQNALARFERDALSWPGVTHIILMQGINDIGFSEIPEGAFGDGIDTTAVTADDIIAGHRQLIARAHARGIKIIGATLTPYIGATYANDTSELKRLAVNEWIRNSGAFDAVVDFDAATQDPQNPAKFQPDLHSGDWLHPNDAGYEVMAGAIDLSLFE